MGKPDAACLRSPDWGQDSSFCDAGGHQVGAVGLLIMLVPHGVGPFSVFDPTSSLDRRLIALLLVDHMVGVKDSAPHLWKKG